MSSIIRIPDAHASTISTVRIVRQQQGTANDDAAIKSELLVVTSGNDHRVKLWNVLVDLDLGLDREECIHADMVLDRYSPVADISSLDVIRGAHEALLVCGVGMEMMRIEQC